MTQRLSTRAIATACTYDPHSLTSTGYDATLYDDGSVGLTRRSRWQGSRDGARWRSRVGLLPVDAATLPEDQTLDEMLEVYVSTQMLDLAFDDDWRLIRRGYLVG